MENEIPAIVWLSGVAFLFAFVWLLDFREKTEAKRRGPVVLYAGFVLLAWALLDDAFGATNGPTPATNGAATGWAMIGAFSLLAMLKAVSGRRPLLALALSILVFLGAAGAMTNAARADLWESDGERSIRQAQAEKIRLEAQAAYQRELALLQSKGFATAPPDDGAAVWPFLVVGIAALAILWAYIENRWREQRDAEIRRLQYQIAIAERQNSIRIPFFDCEKKGVEL